MSTPSSLIRVEDPTGNLLGTASTLRASGAAPVNGVLTIGGLVPAPTAYASLPTGVLVGTLARVTDKLRGFYYYDGTRWVSLTGVAAAKDFGALGDGIYLTDVTTTASSATLTSASAAFTSADVGKVVSVQGAGAAGAQFTTTISAVVSGTQVTMAASASTSVSSANAVYGTDDTSAIQAAMNASPLGLGVFFADGVYIINGALQDTSNSNAQLLLPKVNNFENAVTIRLFGTTSPITTWTTRSGAILQSTLASGNGQLIGVKNPHGTPNSDNHYNGSVVNFFAERMTFRLPQNPTNSCLDFSWIYDVFLRDCRIDVMGGVATDTTTIAGLTLPLVTVAQPTTSTSYGVKMGMPGLGVSYKMDNCAVFGYYTDVRTSELMQGDRLMLFGSKRVLELMGSSIPGYTPYPNTFRYLLTTNSPGGIVATVGPSALIIEQWDVEHDTPTPGSGPSWATPRTYDVDDANNYVTGWYQYHMHDAAPWSVNGAANLVPYDAAQPYNGRAFYPEIFPGFTAQNNAVEMVKRGLPVSGGSGHAAFRLHVTSATGTSDPIGGIVFANDASGSSDMRTAEIYSALDGAANSGNFGIYTANAGALLQALAINHLQQLQLNAYGAGTLTTDASGHVTATSDERLKTEVGVFERGLAALRHLRPRLYRWNERSGMETEGVYAGLFAGEVGAVIPEAVGAGPGGYRTLSDRALISVLINAVQELDRDVRGLERRWWRRLLGWLRRR
jgi:hypothetical protein